MHKNARTDSLTITCVLFLTFVLGVLEKTVYMVFFRRIAAAPLQLLIDTKHTHVRFDAAYHRCGSRTRIRNLVVREVGLCVKDKVLLSNFVGGIQNGVVSWN